jgi:hypothetical protein
MNRTAQEKQVLPALPGSLLLNENREFLVI